jgi:hypothetical protein
MLLLPYPHPCAPASSQNRKKARLGAPGGRGRQIGGGTDGTKGRGKVWHRCSSPHTPCMCSLCAGGGSLMMLEPPHSLHSFLRRWWGQMLEPPHSRLSCICSFRADAACRRFEFCLLVSPPHPPCLSHRRVFSCSLFPSCGHRRLASPPTPPHRTSASWPPRHPPQARLALVAYPPQHRPFPPVSGFTFLLVDLLPQRGVSGRG